MQKIILIIIAALTIGGILGGGIFLYQQKFSNSQNSGNYIKACTEEAKICPDGSAVGRTGPNCEFAPCPAAEVDETDNWKTYADNKYFTIKYPQTWELKLEQAGGVYIYNPKSIEIIDAGGFGTEEIMTEYLSISVEPSSKSAYQVVEEFKKAWEGHDIKSEDASGNGLALVIYDDFGKGSSGRNIAISNGILVAQMNTSIENLGDKTTENLVLGTFKFTN